MLTRIVAGVVVVVCFAIPAFAQHPQTTPPTIDVTCHGYDEGATRAYNCIPVTSQQPQMRTFVPAVGSACNQGSIQEFPPGRIVFQIRCQDGEGGTTTPTPQPTAADYDIVNIRRYLSSIHVADWLEFTWRARVSARRFEVTVKFQQGAFFSSCTETWYNPEAGEQDTETSIPSVCGTDDQWSSVTIQPADGRTCSGCGTFTRSSLPTTDSLSLTSADPAEVPTFIEEATLAAQIGAAER
ncbi:MAG: hypothetical protein OXG44_14945 [Gammaproteobacteria bacterium]|nr:hypothetical protein [Gammaproteobacteria bacterium]